MYVIYLAEGFIDGASDWVYYQSFTNLAQHIYGSREFKLIEGLIHYLLDRGTLLFEFWEPISPCGD